MMELVQKGGPLMWLILACSITALGVFFERLVHLHRASIKTGDFLRGLANLLKNHNLAEAIQGLVTHMRTEQQMIREWADGQGEQNREIKKLLERLARQPEKS